MRSPERRPAVTLWQKKALRGGGKRVLVTGLTSWVQLCVLTGSTPEFSSHMKLLLLTPWC